jgi:uncharacterized membrane protein
MTCERFQVVIIENVRLIIVTNPSPSRPTIQISPPILAVQGTLAGIKSRDVVAFVDGRGRVTNQMIWRVSEYALHNCELSGGGQRVSNRQSQLSIVLFVESAATAGVEEVLLANPLHTKLQMIRIAAGYW